MNLNPVRAARVRHAKADDAVALATFAANSFRQAFAADNSEQHMREHIERTFRAELQAEEIADKNVSSLLAVDGEQLLAYAQVRFSTPPDFIRVDSPVELHRFYVDKSVHGSGIAQLLMQSVMADASSRCATHLWLGVWEANPRAIRFYQKCGFDDVGCQDFYLGTDCQTDRVLLAEVSA